MSSEPRFPLEESQRGWRPEGARQMFLLSKKLHRHLLSGKEGNASTSWMKPTELCWDPSGYWLAAPCRRYLSPPATFHGGYPCSQPGCFHAERLWWLWWGDMWRVWWSVQCLQFRPTSHQFRPKRIVEKHQSWGLIFSCGLALCTHVLHIHSSLATWIQMESFLSDQKWPCSKMCGYFLYRVSFFFFFLYLLKWHLFPNHVSQDIMDKSLNFLRLGFLIW